MQEFIRFALLGLGVGSLYALASQGLIVIYRGSGVLNFGLGAIGMVAAYVEFELATKHGWPFVPALIIGTLTSAIIGMLTHLLIMRQLRRASPLARIIATLGVLVTLQSLAILKYGSNALYVPFALPQHLLHISGDIVISSDRLILAGIAVVISLGLWAFYKFTRFGIATSAVAENQRAAAALGMSPDFIATINWGLGSALAGFAAIFIAPIVTLQASVLTNLILAATAAALLASFRSFSIALAGGLAVGIAETEIQRYVQQPGISTAIPFLLIVIVLMFRGQSLPLRDYFLQRLPAIGSGRINWPWAAVGVAVAVVLLTATSAPWIDAVTITLGSALVMLSIVVLTGYGGQLSLAQFAIAGFGAFVAGRLAATQGLPFWIAAPIGVAATVPLGVLFALPAVRTRGINLAVVTLGLGSALELLVFDNPSYTGGIEGTQVGNATLFGWDVDSIAHPTRYGILVLVCFVGCALLVSNVRRGRTGRRLIAARTNERAAAALGISVSGAKLYAFGLSAGIAALGGILLAFVLPTIDYTSFANFTSLLDVGLATLGGLGYIMGPVIGATMSSGGLDQQILNELSPGIGKYIPLISGIAILVLILANQDGVARETLAQVRWVTGKIRPSRSARPAPSAQVAQVAAGEITPVTARTLRASDVTVKYGGTTALSDVSLTVRPGQITGLIGPNGAGKTTFIDAVTGFARLSGGTLLLDDQDITGWSPTRRARAGLGRSFQSLELFEDATVLDNLRMASDGPDRLSYLRDLVHPVNPPLPSEVGVAIREFGLTEWLHHSVTDLSYGNRRMLAIARAVATHPSLLLLDEPAAGLGDAESAELAALVRRLADDWGMAVLLIEHDMNFVMSVCDEIVVLDFGHVISRGTPQQVRNDQAVIKAYLGEGDESLPPAHVPAPSAVRAERAQHPGTTA
jgi:sulfate-transporting ATPase